MIKVESMIHSEESGKETKPKNPYGFERENGWKKLPASEHGTVEAYSKDYIGFLSAAKTEREAHDIILSGAVAKGFKNLDESIAKNEKLKAGDTVYRSYQGRTLFLAKIGSRSVTDGIRIVGGHIDSPRLDLKQIPLYEDSELAFFDTHYYGGIKKYQWVAMPLAIHGVIIKLNGEKVTFSIGEDDADPVFTITDLLPHLGKEQAKKTLEEGISGEGLNLLIGSRPDSNEAGKGKVKDAILNLLHEKYGVMEEDLQSADIEVVPAGRARELGLDRSMILGYGQDDRICAYPAYRALVDMKETPVYTSVALLCDKEEIGSTGATGMESFFVENTVAEIVALCEKDYSDLKTRRCLEKSCMLSADVNSAHDPNYPDVSSPNGNMAALNCGVVVSKYTGSRGKSGASEASAEFMAEIRRIFNSADVLWQSAELGKVDAGGGGTIALLMARYGMNVIDCGPGLLSMHAPWEVSSKLDAYMAYKAYTAFFKG
jgi:aspartyl aminopeptidase